MSHHRCCCSDTPAFDEFVPCIEVTPNISNRASCSVVIADPTGNPCYRGIPFTYDRVLDHFAGLNQAHKLQLVSAIPGSHPFGTYTYSTTVTVLINERDKNHEFAEDFTPLPAHCAVFIYGENYYWHTATISCEVVYASGVQPKVKNLLISIERDRRHEDHTYEDGMTPVHNSSWVTGETANFFVQDPGTLKNFGTTITNTIPLRTDCTTASNTLVGGGSAKVLRSEDDTCTPYPLTHRFFACGYPAQSPSGGQPDFIHVDLDTRPTGASISDKTQVEYLGWLYNISDLRYVSETPDTVVWTNDRCFPTMIKCDDTESPLPYDPIFQNSYHNSAYLGGVQYKRHASYLRGPAEAFVFSSNYCPTYQLARHCNNASDTIVFDTASRPVDGFSMFWNSKRYLPTPTYVAGPPVVVTWSTQNCYGDVGDFNNICHGLVQGDPRCSNPIYDECDECNNFIAGGGGGGGEEGVMLSGMGRFASDAMLDAMGHDPAHEANIANSGGGCGCDPPRPID